jgi:catechol 2,3-dioxygenase-like lactoylglutathione lyase family enzyme
MSAIAALAGVTIDCPDPTLLGAFYAELAGWQVVHSDHDFVYWHDFVYLGGGGEGINVGLQRARDHRPPVWPDGGSQQMHLDFYVDDLDSAQVRAVELGATTAAHQPGGDRWRVLLDPAGHPFCLCVKI